MKCPYCNNEDTRVIDSREADEGRSTRRRRECEKCETRFSTYEQVEFLNLIVKKKDGKKEAYKKEKLEESIRIASNKRIDDDGIIEIVGDVEHEIRAGGKNEIEARDIGEIVLKKLKEEDEVAYLRFASVFKSFGTGKRFVKELNRIEKEEG